MRLLFFTLIITLPLCLAGIVYADVTGFQTVALSGQTAPGSDAVFSEFRPPAISGNGGVSFTSVLSGPAIDETNDSGLWTDIYGDLELLARRGDPAAGMSKGDFGIVNYIPLLTESDHGVFETGVEGKGINNNNNRAIYSFDSSGLTLLAQKGEKSPASAGGGSYSWVGYASVNQSGQVSFQANIGGGTNSQAIMLDTAGTTELVARSGDPHPSLPAGTTIGNIYRSTRLGDNGGVGFVSTLEGADVEPTNDRAIWGGTVGDLRLVAREGDPAAGLPESYLYSLYDFLPKVNRHGHVAFAARAYSSLIGADIQAIWVESDEGLQPVVKTGDEAVGLAPGTEILGMLSSRNPVLNDNGDVLFSARLTGGDTNIWKDDSIWLARDGELELIARESDRAPDTSSSSHFRTFGGFGQNNRGQVAFHADDGVYTGVWATDVNGELRMIARGGEWMDVDDGPGIDLRYATNILMANNFGDGADNSAAINDHGQVAFVAEFNDGTSGVFVSDIVATLPGDYNFDGFVNGLDFLSWQRGESTLALSEDDYAEWEESFGLLEVTPAIAANIPEPSGGMLTLMGLCLFTLVRRGSLESWPTSEGCFGK